jgi:hypothetical protein
MRRLFLKAGIISAAILVSLPAFAQDYDGDPAKSPSTRQNNRPTLITATPIAPTHSRSGILPKSEIKEK